MGAPSFQCFSNNNINSVGAISVTQDDFDLFNNNNNNNNDINETTDDIESYIES